MKVSNVTIVFAVVVLMVITLFSYKMHRYIAHGFIKDYVKTECLK